MLNICFITDGGTNLGLGHIQQSTTFARELAPEANIVFLTKSDQTVIDKIRENGFTTIWFPDDAGILLYLRGRKPDIVIFDKIDVAEDLARDIKRYLNLRLVIFTNLTAANKYADIAVTADIGSNFENVRLVDEKTGTIYYYGPKYWILRPEFYLYKKFHGRRLVKPTKILLIFGGSDPANLTTIALDFLLQSKMQLNISVVLGAHYGHDDDLLRVLEQHDDKRPNVAIYRNIANVAERMYEADLVLASPGLSAFEALRVGTPVIVIPHNALQRDTYQGFMRMLERDELSNLGAMLEAGEFTFSDDEPIVRMEIGDGIQELKDVIMNSRRTRNNEMG